MHEKSSSFPTVGRQFRIAVLVVAGLGLASGIAHGWLDARWSFTKDVKGIAGRLQELPDRVGDWTLVRDEEISQQVQDLLRCDGFTNRVYVNESTGQQVSMAVIYGPRGPTAVHNPEICYQGAGKVPQAAAQKRSIEGTSDSFWAVTLLDELDLQPSIEVYYSWSDGGPWTAADYARMWPTDRLYKIQLAGTPPAPGQSSQVEEFLQQVLPEVRSLMEGR